MTPRDIIRAREDHPTEQPDFLIADELVGGRFGPVNCAAWRSRFRDPMLSLHEALLGRPEVAPDLRIAAGLGCGVSSVEDVSDPYFEAILAVWKDDPIRFWEDFETAARQAVRRVPEGLVESIEKAMLAAGEAWNALSLDDNERMPSDGKRGRRFRVSSRYAAELGLELHSSGSMTSFLFERSAPEGERQFFPWSLDALVSLFKAMELDGFPSRATVTKLLSGARRHPLL